MEEMITGELMTNETYTTENRLLSKRVTELVKILRETEASLAHCEFWKDVEQVKLSLETVTRERKSELYGSWAQETNYDPKTLQWRNGLTISEEKIVGRWECLHSYWNEETNDPETEAWREELTEHEERMVDAWDGGYQHGVETVAKQIVEAAEKNKHGVAAKLEAAKQQVAERSVAVPPREHPQSRSNGHSR